ncbi:MAG TPA: hypothetical protein VI819_00635 [Patescibacteria group bacterium]|nr:hypothetical protein [Patescibacteria group bacterium]
MGRDRKNGNHNNSEVARPGQTQNLGVVIDGCAGCSHPVTKEGGLMVGCDQGVGAWQRINCGLGVCRVAAIESKQKI